MSGVSAIALSSAAYAQDATDAQVEEVVVTGSRVIANGNQAPTPVTVISTEALRETAPATLGDALNRLPQFSEQTSVRGIGSAGQNSSASTISLRKFGANRTLILVDGSRVPPTAANGAVDTNIIPQGLVQRVEIVTGGASAVYGSDAVTGVVNFVIDRNFNGLKFNSQYGISTYGDTRNWRIGGAAGRDLFDGRGHIEFSFDHYDADGLRYMESRPEGVNYPTIGGAGTAANPYRVIYNGRNVNLAPGGLITAPTNVPALRDITFKANGVPSPFIHGGDAGVTGLESGGDGVVFDNTSIASELMTNQYFGRFDYDLTDAVHFHTQLAYNNATNYYPYTSAAETRASYASGNPFIPPSIQAIMTANNVPFITVAKLGKRGDGTPSADIRSYSTSIFWKTGLEGRLAEMWDWNANYTYSRSTLHTSNLNNRQNAKIAAAADAVVNPANGRIVCAVSLTPAAGLYPGCLPVNPFGPTSIDIATIDWLSDETAFTLANLMHDVNFSISGSPISLWAGPVTMAVSGEYRFNSLRNNSSGDPAAIADCTGLRNIGTNCTATTLEWASATTASMYAKQNVKEVAGELLIPIIRDVPFFQSFEVNLAGRYTDYSTSGSVETWKAGGTWQVTDDFKIRGTMSRDIRAPTLNDLFAPVSSRLLGFSDLHTGVVRSLNQYSQGNPNLKPEVARTNTIGVVYQPSWAPRFSVALDYFEITINNAIANVAAGDANVQRECLDSGGTSPVCSLFERPLPFSNRTPDNFPTKTYTQSLNSAGTWTRGWDFEANYRLQLADLVPSVPGDLALRLIGTYQPVRKSQSIASLPPTESAGLANNSKLRMNLNAAYSSGGLNVAATARWQSGAWFSDPRRFVDLRGRIPAYTYVDLAISYRTEISGHEFTPFLTVENLFNKRPPVAGHTASVPGLFYPSAEGYDVIGRYFTMGVRGRF